ncbi:MAG: BRCT domain-containing protein [Pseudomonadales bacterium]|nr:BRCT domain-containing protein [Pseudomonadales bacterium]
MVAKAKNRTTTRIQDRSIDELIGICRGVIADGVVDEREAIFLGQWIENHRDIAERWPVNILYARITEMLKDGVLSRGEQGELLETLREITGDSVMVAEPGRSTTLPLDKPAPKVSFVGKTFCLTGRFVFGSNLECEETILELGGSVDSSPGKDTDYLVIGELCSPDWAHTTFGRSIERAIELQEQGAPISIISEEHWVDSLAG